MVWIQPSCQLSRVFRALRGGGGGGHCGVRHGERAADGRSRRCSDAGRTQRAAGPGER